MSVLDEVSYRRDVQIWPAVEAMAACLCRELADAGLPETCFCGVLPGAVPSDQSGEELMGQAWVRVVAIYPSSTFPSQDTRPRSSCASELVAELELGVLRCAPLASDDGRTPPSMAEQWEISRLVMADAAAMHRAAICCYDESDLVVVGRYTPYGPAGGLVGGTWNVFVSQSATPARGL